MTEKETRPWYRLVTAANGNLLFAFIVQTVGIVVWLTMMRADVNQLQKDHAEIHRAIEVLDQNGRSIEFVRQRQIDVIAINASQDQRMREIDQKLTMLQLQVTEHKVWLDQLIAAIRTFSHPEIVGPQRPSPIPQPRGGGIQLQGDGDYPRP